MTRRGSSSECGRHEMTPWDRGDVSLRHRSERVLSPAQRDETTDAGPIPPAIEWTDLAAYTCRSCRDDCLNWAGSDCAQVGECRSCYRVRGALLSVPTAASERASDAFDGEAPE